jgi:hypothetical protein
MEILANGAGSEPAWVRVRPSTSASAQASVLSIRSPRRPLQKYQRSPGSTLDPERMAIPDALVSRGDRARLLAAGPSAR